MLEMGYPPHVVDLLVKLYRKKQARVRVAGVISNWFRVKKGVRTRLCSFTLSIQYIIRNGHERNTRRISRWITDWWSKNIKLRLRYADDIVLIATSEQELQVLVDRLNTVSNQYNLMINVDKNESYGNV